MKRIVTVAVVLFISLASFAQSDSSKMKIKVRESSDDDLMVERPPKEEEAETAVELDTNIRDIFDLFTGPVFKEGDFAGLRQFIKDSTRYPAEAKDSGISGTILIQFVVETDGTIARTRLLKASNEIAASSLRKEFEQEAIRCIKSTSGMWKPATDKDKPVRMWNQAAVTFRPN